MSAHTTEPQAMLSTQLQDIIGLEISTDTFWLLLEGGYVGTVLCQHPVYQQAQLTVQQFSEPELFGIAFYQPGTETVLQAIAGTQQQMIEQLNLVTFESGWSFFPATEELSQG